ncbi:EamA family transporter [Anaerofilum sp. BX8]|uniref:EamA family transporter n=1 Tax=Anaerofilum hominis TaxID=2763016 RepID=A0A923L2C7_9FIRM|nr:DMT family transporter [Anaerofilum hominis]MBC5582516.1 EamA family transporter [Anaerofilum hominis]
MRREAAQAEDGRKKVLAAALMFSISGVCVKLIPWSPLAINGARGAVGALVMGLWFAGTGHRFRLNGAVLTGALALCLTNILYVFSTKLTTAANAILLQYTSPIFVVLLLWLGFGKRPRRLDLTACFFVFCGILFFFFDSLTADSLLGNFLGLASGLTYAGVFLVNLLPGADSMSSFLLAQLMGAALGAPFLLGERSFPPAALAAAALMGVFQIGLGFLLLSQGLAVTPAVTANLICAVEPILNPTLVALLCGERPGRFALVGAVIVLAGVIGYNVMNGRPGARGQGGAG